MSSLAMGVPYAVPGTGFLPTAVLTVAIYTTAVLPLIQSGAVSASQDTHFNPILLSSVHWSSRWSSGARCARLDHTYGTLRSV